jgi:hypothetical protein
MNQLRYVDQVQVIVKALPKRNTPSPDGITNEGVPCLCLLVNSVMTLGVTAAFVMLLSHLKPG